LNPLTAIITTFGAMQKSYGKLYLIPNFLAEDNPSNFLPDMLREQVHHLKHFIVETEKDARALIKKLAIATPQNELQIFLWNEHSKKNDAHFLLKALENGNDAGIITDAGLPCIADPGSDVVALAHQKNIEVIPLPGASSIFMALMGSGMNGQGFTFHGYLPVNRAERVKRIKELERDAGTKRQSQIFMETPYRNNHLFEDVLKHCDPNTRVCVAANISSSNQLIKTKTVKEWNQQKPDLHKIPAIFIIG
jgi:16S rRNA (cytidine1402-2'-O)-methyltransferase